MSYDTDKYPLNPEVAAYLDAVEAHFPQDRRNLGVDEIRDLYLTMCASLDVPLPDNVEIADETVAGRSGDIPVRFYSVANQPSDTTVIYYHGGGFVFGTLDSHNSICAEFALASGCQVVAVDYRLAPEHVHPAHFEDALDAFLALDSGRTVIVGDSAGATLAASVCIHQQRSSRQAVGQVLIYPWLGGELLDLPSYRECADSPSLKRRDIRYCDRMRSAGDPANQDPAYYPLAHSDYSDLPPCVAFAAQYDPLRDDAAEYVRRLKSSGVPAECVVEAGLVHGYMRGRFISRDIGDGFRRICRAIGKLAESEPLNLRKAG